MGAVKTLHVIGYKNSGKTTLIARWVRLLKKMGYSVAVLKHHGHGGALSMPDSETDAMQFFTTGADVSIVAGGGAVQLLMNEEPDFTQLKQLAITRISDVLLIEGYKEQMGDKVVLLRSEEDWQSLHNVQGVQLVVGAPDTAIDYPHISSRAEDRQLDFWLLDWIGREEHDETV
ncbi:molybdopterin-guanine dinucleotide biosynthesis protein B [Filibacter tadaridae]|uniref:Molybdopterin-guanine dinucleotide biosynthesis protein B n=1 Tax=Filibacter tadaridae TaxID=2483811 RepID=A0A3P5WZ76_9BACL|nr:molybdopterin-guanine dinucleotide biosynthesis protein B [Filibacter tadaridae]VDC23636.1 molybdopterin-guanine dinucleotide biosynthesis protein B [Filibacter tadaridae]